ncbi:hypothetical protein SAMN05660297_02941 [Natronincola peptidivorans]|uniref:Uncharacterized protein n=1 Tax=Natronincola peptidivorans TaxID=426128 RepID=A0A1I0FTM7_9FIRM|nr:hypothetical protein SAMN05660297_02941 [Natronincola peptidivorans]
MNSKRIVAICLKILSIVRNYTSHDIDSNFYVFQDSKYAIEMYMIILNCYLIAYKLVY